MKEYLTLLTAVLWKLKEEWLKLKPSKCEFLQKSLTYLGHKVSEKGIKTDDHKIKWYRKGLPPKQ